MCGSLQGMPVEFLLRPLDAPPAYAAVVDRVRRAVALGVLLPGDRLPAERALAEGLGVSRVTVREALRVLQGEGLLITKRGSGGTIVSPTVTSLGADSKYNERVGEVFELRLAVETMAARLAAERGVPQDMRWLETCQEALQSSRDVHAFRRADSEFHLAVARMSGNGMLSQVVEDVRAAVFSRLDRHDFAVIYESSIRGHAAVIEAIKNRDASAASAAMATHIEEARDEVMAVLSDAGDQRALGAGSPSAG
jgi:GntR family transcriptional repressor for pyruvate dehydrogenase complex